MGNRAVITNKANKIGIYLHWNGGPESITGFCEACKTLGFCSPNNDESHGFASMALALGAFFGASGLNVGINTLDRLDCDNYDNGVYVIGDNWEIAERYGYGSEQRTELTPDERAAADGVRDQTLAAVKKLRGE